MQVDSNLNALAIHRLTALWALSECGLGGFMHAFKSPLTGVFVGGVAIVMISMLLKLSNNNFDTILKSLLIVLIIKMGVSPHSGISAYLAVAFQSMAGWICFQFIANKTLAVSLFSLIAILESAFQKLIVLTILFGKSIWEATDQFVTWINKNIGILDGISGSKLLIAIYLIFHLIASLLIAYFTISLLRKMDKLNPNDFNLKLEKNLKTKFSVKNLKKKKTLKFFALVLFLLLGSLFFFSDTPNASFKAMRILARTILILLIYFLILGPLLLGILRKYLNKNKEKFSLDIENTFSLFPYLLKIIKLSWDESKSLNKLKRLSDFVTRVIFYSIHFKIVDNDHS